MIKLELRNPDLYVYACDFSSKAIEVLKQNEEYDETKCKAFVSDITDLSKNEFPIKEGQLDIIVMIFVLSAIKPEKYVETIQNLVKYLKPGGKLLFRDYGLYDMAQLRFKPGKCIENNFYVRGDGTLVKFFSQGKIYNLLEFVLLFQIKFKILYLR
jgi:SAM-dependent methyltransferase